MARPFPLLLPLLATAAALALAAGPAAAASSASSASSEASSASIGSVSDSFGSSSDSSKGDAVAAGDYRIVRVAAAEQPGKLALTLEGADGRGFVLVLPEATARAAALAEGGMVTARSRSFGWEFAVAGGQGDAAQPFFLVVHDAHRREFANRKVEA